MNNLRTGACSALSLLLMLFMTACSVGTSNSLPGGGGGDGGGGGTVASSTGEIAGFGSIIVNGIEYTRKSGLADDRVKLRFGNISGASESQLKLGMVVKVKGTFDSTTGKGEYEAIEYQPELRGQVDSIDNAAGTITVMGRTIQIDTNSQLDGLRDLAELQAVMVGGNHPELEISGNLDNNGIVHATRIAMVAANFANNGLVTVKGAITAVGAGTFAIGGVIVSTAGATFENMTASDIAIPLVVEVKGNFNTTSSTITNATIERKDAVEAKENDHVSFKGFANAPVANNSFTLNGPNGAITVKTATAAFFKNGVAADSAIVTAGVKLQVEGSVDAAGAIVATKVAIEREKNLKLLGSLSGKDSTNGTLTVNGVTVSMLPVTRFIDSSNARLSALTLADLTITTDYVEIAGFINAAGALIAAQVQRFDPPANPANRSIVQGPVSSATANTMEILGITVKVGSTTQYELSNKTLFPGGQTAFMTAIVPNVTVVKAKGKFTAPDQLDATGEEVQLGQ